MINGLIFDFDGLILDTETPEFEAWQEIYHRHGYELPLTQWEQALGSSLAAFDPINHLETLVTEPLNRSALREEHRQRSLELLGKRMILPGVEEKLRSAKNLGIKLGLASSSPRDWVYPHLQRLGLLKEFDCLRTADDVSQVKPNPELYLSALHGLQIDPDQGIAFEDSPNGVRAAKAAGLFCVAVPNPLTAQLDLSQADLILPSLAKVILSELIAQAETLKQQSNGHHH